MADIHDLFNEDEKNRKKDNFGGHKHMVTAENMHINNSKKGIEYTEQQKHEQHEVKRTADIHDMFESNEELDADNNEHMTASEIIKIIIRETEVMSAKENEIKKSMLEQGLKLYKIATKDVDMSCSKMTYNDIPQFLCSPLMQTIGKSNGRHFYLFDEKVGDTTYSLTLFTETKMVDKNYMTSGIAIEILKYADDKIYCFNHATKTWEIVKEIEEQGQNKEFKQETINKFLDNVFKADTPYDTEYQNSIYNENGGRSYLLELMTNDDADFTDEEYEEFFEEHKMLLSLYDQVSESMTFEPDDTYGLILIPRDVWHMGFAITDKNGYYEILQYIDEDSLNMISEKEGYFKENNYYIHSVGRTKSMNTVLRFIRLSYDAKRGKKRAFTFPFSAKTLICVCGENIKEICSEIKEKVENTIYSEKELKNIYTFLHIFSQINS